jgi:hypothetical protein
MFSPAMKPPCGLAARHSRCLAARRVRRSEPRIESRLTSNCGTNCRTDCRTDCGTNPTTCRPRVSLVPVRDFASQRFSTSLTRPRHHLLWVRSEFALWFVPRYALRFRVPVFGMSCFADGGAGFRCSCGFDISTTSNRGRLIASLAARTSRVVVARRRLSRIARRVVLAPNPLCADGMGSGRLE